MFKGPEGVSNFEGKEEFETIKASEVRAGDYIKMVLFNREEPGGARSIRGSVDAVKKGIIFVIITVNGETHSLWKNTRISRRK